MAAGSLLGGYLGGKITAHLTDRTLVRAGVVALGLGVAAYYFWRIYGHGFGGDLERVVRLFARLKRLPRFFSALMAGARSFIETRRNALATIVRLL